MNTPSHFLMTATVERLFPRVPIVKSAFLLGSVAPDLPLWLLSIGGIAYYRMLGWEDRKIASHLFDQLFFHDPIWMALHNFWHAPLILLAGLVLVWRKRRNITSRSRWWFWFLLAAGGHTIIDIVTHATDGPLIFFPLNWSIRFQSPISYWDDRYYGRQFQQFELGLDLLLLLYLASSYFYQRLQKRRSTIRSRSSN